MDNILDPTVIAVAVVSVIIIFASKFYLKLCQTFFGSICFVGFCLCTYMWYVCLLYVCVYRRSSCLRSFTWEKENNCCCSGFV